MGTWLDKTGLTQIKGILTTKFATKVDKHPDNVDTGKYLQIDSTGEAVWGDPPSQQAITDATADWLDDHYPSRTEAVVDNTLTTANAAADAKAAGDLVMVSATAPSISTSPTNKLWIKNDGETEYQIPTYAEHEELKSTITLINDYNIKWEPTGHYINESGTEGTSSSYTYTGLIPVIPGTKINVHTKIHGHASICMFGADGVYLTGKYVKNETGGSAVLTDYTFTVDENAYYIKASCYANAKNDFSVTQSILPTVIDDNQTIAENSGRILNLETNSALNRGFVRTLGYSALSSCVEAGWYGFTGTESSQITDLPADFGEKPGAMLVLNETFGSSIHGIMQMLFNDNESQTFRQSVWIRYKSTGDFTDWRRIARSYYTIEYYDSLANLGITSIQSIKNPGWYRFSGSQSSSITDLPSDYTGTAGTVLVIAPSYGGMAYVQILLYDADGNMWQCICNNSGTYRDWKLMYGPLINAATGADTLRGKTVAVIGDSISTNGNVPEIIVKNEDVGVQLSAYVTFRDVYSKSDKSATTGKTVGGHTFTEAEIGTEVSFVPTSDDIGKTVGVPENKNNSSVVTWWEVAQQKLGFSVIPVCWSGSSITSHEGNDEFYKTSYAWHPAQIRKCGIRIPGTMTRTAPDMIIVYRGTNDFSHSPYSKLTSDYFSYPWTYPQTDEISGGYGYKEGLCLTIRKLREAYPLAKIVLCTCNFFKRGNYSSYPINNGQYTENQLNNAIREVADWMGCPVIEFDKDGLTFENASSTYYSDTEAFTHPTTAGHKIMGDQAIKNLVGISTIET